MGGTQLQKQAGAEVQNFGVWSLRPQPTERGVSGHNKGVPFGARETVTNVAQPMAPAVPRATWASHPAISVSSSGLAPCFSEIPVPKTD